MKMLDREALGQRLHLERQKKGLTTREAEALTGVSKTTISRAERGSAECFQNAESILLLTDFYGFDARGYLIPKPVEQDGVFHMDTPVRQDAGGVS